MMEKTRNRYNPSVVPHPGLTLEDFLEDRAMSQKELSDRTGLSTKAINELIKGKTLMRRDTAELLEPIFGLPASFWLDKVNRYQEYLSVIKKSEVSEEQASFINLFPIKEAIKKELFPVVDLKNNQEVHSAFLNFFNVSGVEQWKTMWCGSDLCFRKSEVFEQNFFATSLWIRAAEIEAVEISCNPVDLEGLRELLPRFRKMTVMTELDKIKNELRSLLSSVGVAFVVLPELKGCVASGVTKWFKNKVMLLLSNRHKTNDSFWFSFFHEIGHILLHGKKEVFVDIISSEEREMSEQEREADSFALNTLIDKKSWSKYINSQGYRKQEAITAFANELGIAKGIIAGRLQKEFNLWHMQYLHKLKIQYK